MDDVVLKKAAIIERCVARVYEVYADAPANLRDDLTRQDSIILNIQRACEAVIDLAMHLVRASRLGLPEDSRAAFDLLGDAGYLEADLGRSLKRMVGFRNVAVHAYQTLNLDIVQAIIERQLADVTAFAEKAVKEHG